MLKHHKIIINTIYQLACILFKKKDIVLFQGSGKIDAFGNISAIKQKLDEKNISYKLICKPINFIDFISLAVNLAKAKIVLFDSQSPAAYIKISKKTIFICCWHACGAYKTLGFDTILNKLSEEAKQKEALRISRIFKKVDYWICSSPEQAYIYSKALKKDYKYFLPLGIPRTDAFFRIKNKKKNKTIILFAPTFRGRKERIVPKPFNINNFNFDNVCFAYRGHPTSAKNIIQDNWVDFSNKNYFETLVEADILITDYSSILFDFLLINKPVILFVPDLVQYQQDDFPLYFLPEELTSNFVAYSFEELKQKITLVLDDKYKVNTDIKKRMLSSCDGNACNRVVDFITSLKSKLL